MTNILVQAHKHETLPLLYQKVLAVLEKHGGRGRVIPFPELFKILSWGFRLNKDESFALLQELRAQGVLELRAYHGIVLK